MNTTIKLDRVILIKELNDKVRKVGEVYEIANVLEDSFVLREAKSKIAVAVISFEDFDKHFVHEPNFKGWTNWTFFTGFDGQNDCVYRTNGKKIQVKFITDKVRAESSLNVKDGDEFNLYFGLHLAYFRARNKALKKKVAEYEEELKQIDVEMMDNERMMKKMINSLIV